LEALQSNASNSAHRSGRLNAAQQTVVALFVLEDQSHHQRDHGITAGVRDVLVLTERLRFRFCVRVDSITQALDRTPTGSCWGSA